MSELLDREYQKVVLTNLAEAYPYHIERETYNSMLDAAGSEKKFDATLLYLEDHGLITSGFTPSLDGSFHLNLGGLKITHKGLDFLAEDGGLSAILGVVTVKLDAETIKSIISARVDTAAISEKDKSRIKDFLASASDKTLTHLTKHLVDYSLSQGKEAIDWLIKQIGS